MTEEFKKIGNSIGGENVEPNKFSQTKRDHFGKIVCDESDEIACNRVITDVYSSKPYCIKDTETTSFSTNEPLVLIGVLLLCDEGIQRQQILTTQRRCTDRSNNRSIHYLR